MTASDPWSRWVLGTRNSQATDAVARWGRWLCAVRDQVLDHAQLGAGTIVLDVGAGDGLIAFGALERVGATGQVIFCDISQPLLDHSQAFADQLGMRDHCRFVQASADHLQPIADESVDVVTTRSVLIYVADTAAALREFWRVLKPGGRISLFEPINRFMVQQPATRFSWQGYDVTPVLELAERIRAAYHRSAAEQDPMLAFDERDLLRWGEQAGFTEIHLALYIDLQPPEPEPWDAFLNTAGNPLAPALGEVLAQVLTRDEVERFAAHVRPQVEAGRGTKRSAVVYLWATKGGEREGGAS
jgi:ubiquinone/menaquinone biosynthesis C-methylase UbiE